jgi:hypothetical protein
VKPVFVADSPAHAHLVSGLLEEEGIHCVVEGEMLFGARGDLGLTTATLPRVIVSDEDAPRAIGILREHQTARAAEPPEIDDDPDARVPPLRWKRLSVIAVLWLLVAAVSARAIGGIGLPFVAAAAFIQLYLEIDRDS